MARFYPITFGCQMNRHDTDRIGAVLTEAGHEHTSDLHDAQLVVINTCSVREKAEQKLRSEVGRIGLLKRKNPQLLIAVAGCLAQQEGERLIRRLPQIDMVVGPDQAQALPELVRNAERGSPPQVRTEFDLEAPRFLSMEPQLGGGRISDFVTTMKGCDERCTFCVVPYTRGPERYRPSADIISEVAALVSSGRREVTLLGQTVDSYRDPSNSLAPAPAEPESFPVHTTRSRRNGDETEFPALLRAIAREVPQLKRLRYTSPHPRHLTPALVAAHRDLPVLARHVHMPVQSGSDLVLKRMLRRYTRAEYVERIHALRQAVEDITVSTDIIVGFPGETEEDFQQTLSLVEEIGFVGIFAFKYSERPNTPAQKLDDDVAEEVKSERLARLFRLSEALQQAHLKRLVGSVQQVLIEERSTRGGHTGRTERNEIVHVPCCEAAVGEVIEVRVERAFKHSLQGQCVDAKWRATEPEPTLRRAQRQLAVLRT